MSRVLRPRHRAVARALAEALFHHDAGPPPARIDATVDALDAQLAVVSRTQRALLVLALELLRWLPILLFASWRVFEAIDVEARVRFLERMEKSRSTLQLLVLIGFKTMLSMIFYEQPDELRAMGYPGDARKRWLRVAR